MVDIAPPQWNAPKLQPMRDLITACFGGNKVDAITRMQALLDVPGNPDPPAPVPPAPPNIPKQPQEDELQPTVRKKTTFTDFDLESTIPEHLPFFPAPYATDKIKAMECENYAIVPSLPLNFSLFMQDLLS